MIARESGITLPSTSVLVRVDASADIGLGHLSRCLTLATAMHAQGARVAFACGGDIALCRSMVQRHGFEVVVEVRHPDDDSPMVDALGEAPGFNIVVIDHYELGAEWERVIADAGPKVAVIDDLARVHECAILLDQNLYPDAEQRYEGKLPADCILLIGPSNALLRPEFEAARPSVGVHTGEIHSVLVSYGGSDPSHETAKAITALLGIAELERIDVVVGPAMLHAEELRRLSSDDPRFVFHIAPEDMARLMVGADLALGAGGSTNWERCMLGVPALITTVASNQVEVASELASRGAVRLLGSSEDVSVSDIHDAVVALIAEPDAVRTMSVAARDLLAGYTGVQHVAREMLEVARARS